MIHTHDKVIKHKVGLLNLAEALGNVSTTCKMRSLSGDRFYRYKAAADEGGVEILFDQNRRGSPLNNRVNPLLEAALPEYALEPAYGQTRTSHARRKRGTFASPSGSVVSGVDKGWRVFKNRLKWLSDNIAREGLLLTDSQIAGMERKA